MTLSKLLCFILAAGTAAHADFSYTTVRKGAAMPGANIDATTKHYFKGDKMASEMGETTMIIDFDAQTVTSIDKAHKTYTVSKVSDFNSDAAKDAKIDMSIDFKETGQHKTINGFDVNQAVMTMQMDMAQGAQSGMKMQMEMELWVSPDVPGYKELEAFYKRNMSRFPWAAMVPNTTPSMRDNMIAMQKKMAQIHGAPVLEIMRTKMAMTPQQQAQMDKARAQMEAMQKQGGPQAAAMAQAMARITSGGGMEITSESSGFSAAPVPDSVFAIPAGYQQAAK
jgi:Domain of unknown function (DUF4412)